MKPGPVVAPGRPAALPADPSQPHLSSGQTVTKQRDADPVPADASPPRHPHRTYSRLLGVVAPLLLGGLLLGGWYLITTAGRLPTYLLPGPAAVARELYRGLIGQGYLWQYLPVTFGEAGLGCVTGAVIALPLAVLINHSRWAAAAVSPFLGATQAIPAIALAPLLVIWVGYGLSGVTALCALMVFFPILVSAVVGLRHLDPDILAAAAVDGAGFWRRLWHIELPLAGATILAGVRNGFTLSITGAVVGEMVMGGRGLGTLLTAQRDNLNTQAMIATIIVLAVLASAIYSLIAALERRLFVLERSRYAH